MVACGALRVTWLSGLMESGRPIKFSSTLFITGGGGGGGFCVGGGRRRRLLCGGGGVTREDLSLLTECKGGTIEH